jgi:hypothetical protein
MAVTADTYYPFDSGAGADVTEEGWRRFMRYLTGRGSMANGVIRGVGNQHEVYADSSGMQVKVRTGEVWERGHWGELTGEKTLPIAAADPTNPRKDRVIARAAFGDNRIEYDVLQGTAAVSPTAPSVTQSDTKWETSLAVVDVPAAASTIAASNVADARLFIDDLDITPRGTVDITVNNSTTLTDATGLSALLSAGGLYLLDGYVEYSAATAADAKLALTVPASTTGRWYAHALDSGTTGTAGNLSGASNSTASTLVLGGAAAGTRCVARLSGWLQMPSEAAAGSLMNVQLQFAQNTANASNAVLYLNSWLRFTRYRT